MTDIRRVLVAGCGSIGMRHLRNLAALGLTDLHAFDPDPARLAEAETHGAVVYPSYDEALVKRPDVVFVAAPTQVHVELAGPALELGCHLFMEKPLSHRMEGVPALVDVARRGGLVTMVGCNMRFHPGPAKVKALVEDGVLGRILWGRFHAGSFLPAWRPGSDYRTSYSASPVHGGVVLDLVHELDLARWMLGPARVRHAALRRASSIGLEAEGIAEILLEHEADVLTNVHLNFIQRDYHRGIHLVGEKGSVEWRFQDHEVRWFAEDGGLQQLFREPEGWQANDMYVEEARSFLDAVRHGRQAMNPLDEAAETLEMALQVRAAGGAS